MLKYVRQRIKKWDDNPAVHQANFKGVGGYRTTFGGCLSLIYIGLMLIIVGFKVWDMLERTDMYFDSVISKKDYSAISLQNITFRLSLNDSITRQRIAPSQYLKYGVNTSVNYIHYKKGIITTEEYNLTICEEQQFRDWLCLPHHFDLHLFGRTDVIQQDGMDYRRIAIIIKPCNTALSEQCEDFYLNMQPYLMFLNHNIDPQCKNMNEAIQLNSFRYFPLTTNLNTLERIERTFEFKKIIFHTDNSLLPSFLKPKAHEQMVSTWLYDEENQEETYLRETESDYFLKVMLKRSLYTTTYQRSFQKVDTVLAQIFGFATLFSFLVYIFSKGYNQWRFLQYRREVFYGQEQSTNFCAYLCHLMKKWGKLLFCCEREKEDHTNKLEDTHWLNMRISKLEKQMGLYRKIILENRFITEPELEALHSDPISVEQLANLNETLQEEDIESNSMRVPLSRMSF